MAEGDGAHDVTEDNWRMHIDDRTNGTLDSKLVAAARKWEIKNLDNMGVYVGSTVTKPILACTKT